MSTGNSIDQTSTVVAGSPSSSTNNVNNGGSVNANSTAFQPVRQLADAMAQQFDNSMQMFGMKQQQQQQQPMTSPITGTIYTGPPAKYFNNGGINSNGYATGGSMRPMLPQQGAQHRYGSYNGNASNNGQPMQQQRRQNNNGVDNATNDSIK